MRVIQFYNSSSFEKPAFITDLKNILGKYDEVYGIDNSPSYTIIPNEETGYLELSSKYTGLSMEFAIYDDYGFIVLDDNNPILTPIVVKTLWQYTDYVAVFPGNFIKSTRRINVHEYAEKQITNSNVIYSNFEKLEIDKLFDYGKDLIVEKVPLVNGLYAGLFIKPPDTILNSRVIEEVIIGDTVVYTLNDINNVADQSRRKNIPIIELKESVIHYIGDETEF